MEFKFNAVIKNFDNAGFIGCIEGFRGLVVQGSTKEEVIEELSKSLFTKLIYDLGLDQPTKTPLAHICKPIKHEHRPAIFDKEEVGLQFAL